MSPRTNVIGAFSLMLMATGMLLEAVEDGLKGSAAMVGVPSEWMSGTDWLSAASTSFFFSAGLLGTVREIDLLLTSQQRAERPVLRNGLGALAQAAIPNAFECRNEGSFEVIADGLSRIREGLRMAWTEATGPYL